VDGKVWPTSEHYFQASKFPNDQALQESIRVAESGIKSWSLGQSGTIRSDWEEVKVEMMYLANFAKFSQNQHLREVLVNSMGQIEAQGNPDGWKTWNEILLERIREELRDASDRDSLTLRSRIDYMDAYRAAAKEKDEYAMKVVVRCAASRTPMPKATAGSLGSLQVSGMSQGLDGTYKEDFLVPEVNGQKHYFRREGGHLYLGIKQGRKAWVVDEDLCPSEASGTCYLDVVDTCELPLSEQTWQCFDDDAGRHQDRLVSIHAF